MSDKKIVVYSKPNCMQCKYVKQMLDRNDIPFKEIDVFESEGTIEHIKETYGAGGLPVTVIDGEAIIGFNQEKLTDILGIDE